jgi:serine/threonine protein kinase
MNPVMRPAGVPPEAADESAIKSWLDALASGDCDVPAFLRFVQERLKAAPDTNWEVLSQLDQYYRRGKIDADIFHAVKNALAESALGVRNVQAHRENKPAADATDDLKPSDDLKPGSVLRRRYRIESVLGHGAMGTAFQALDEYRLETPPGGQRLAIKVLHASVAARAELLTELRQEFQQLQLLSHPNILRVFEFDRDGAVVFFTMELFSGAQLSRVLWERRLIPLGRAQALAAIRDIGAAIAHAHSRGVVHGDINPQNVVITMTGELRVRGFGAWHRSSRRTTAPDNEATLPSATAGYASCQMLEGEPADAGDDVFALACVAYLLLCGEHPFSKRTSIEARDAGLRPRRPPKLTNQQWQTLRAGLSFERSNRPADMQQWLEQLDLGAAAKHLAPLPELLESQSRQEPKSPFAVAAVSAVATAVAMIACLAAAGYWIVSRQIALPDIDRRVPAAAAPTHVEPASAPVPAAVPIAAAALASPPAMPTSLASSSTKIELAADTLDSPATEVSAQVPVHRKGSLRGETSFTWWTESGTAKPGIDFSAVVPQLAYIGDGKSSISLSIPLIGMPRAQPKSFYVVIDQSEGGAALGARTLTMVTLLPSE